MTRGPGRHSERNFRAAEQHYNAAEWPTDAERGNVPLCRHQIKSIIIIIIIIIISFIYLLKWGNNGPCDRKKQKTVDKDTDRDRSLLTLSTGINSQVNSHADKHIETVKSDNR